MSNVSHMAFWYLSNLEVGERFHSQVSGFKLPCFYSQVQFSSNFTTLFSFQFLMFKTIITLFSFQFLMFKTLVHFMKLNSWHDF